MSLLSHRNSSGFDAGLRGWTPCQLIIPKFLLLRDSWLRVSNRGQDCSRPGSPVFRYLLEFAQVLEAGSNIVYPGGGRQSPREDSKVAQGKCEAFYLSDPCLWNLSEAASCLPYGGRGFYFRFSLGSLRQHSDCLETKPVLDPKIVMSRFIELAV